MKKIRWAAIFFLPALMFFGCASADKTKTKLYLFDLTDQRVADISLVRKLVGKSDFLFFSKDVVKTFLEGYIQGFITDYHENPIEGVVVRAVPEGSASEKAGFGAEAGKNVRVFESLSFDAGVSDSNGLYRIRFSLPVVDKIVDIRGRLIYNSGWEQQKSNLGRAYEPQTKETPFRLYYNSGTGFLALSEGVRKSIVQPISDSRAKTAPPGAQAPPPALPVETEKQKKDKADEDLFKGFNFGE